MHFKWRFRHIVFIFPFLGLSLIMISILGMLQMNSEYEVFEVLNSSMVNCPAPTNFTDSIADFKKYTDLAVARQIQQNEEEMWNQNFTSEEYTILEEFFDEPEKTKIVMIFATWRSGSTFLGEVLQSHPAMYYHFEPLMYLQSTQVNNATLEDDTLPLIENLINCNYTANHDLPIFDRFNDTQFWIHYHNPRLWQYCSCDYKLCRNSPFIERICGTFPFQTMKLVRLRLSAAERFINDATNEVKVVHLVRDPRAIWVSRQPHGWCRLNADCWDVKRLCKDMVDDYYSYQYLKEIYPEKVFLVKFEKLSLNPETETKRLMQNLGLSFHPFMQKFIQTHTVGKPKNLFDTFRNSSSVAVAWKDYYKGRQKELERIESDCKEAMSLWGYL